MTEPAATILHEGRFIRLMRRGAWEYAERHACTGGVVIVAVTREQELLIITQFRPPLSAQVIELPAGLANDTPGADPEADIEAAKRELLEETGYTAPHWRLLGRVTPSPGICNEMISYFAAEGAIKVDVGGGVEGESIHLHRVPLNQVDPWLLAREQQGEILSGLLHAGLYLLRARPMPFQAHHPPNPAK